MPAPNSLPRVVAMLFILPMIGFGLALFSSGSFVWFNRQYVVLGYLICGAIFVIAGTTMLASAFGILGSTGRWRFPVQAGSAAMLLSGVATFAGIALKVIPCEGPTWLRNHLISGGGLFVFGIAGLIAARRVEALDQGSVRLMG